MKRLAQKKTYTALPAAKEVHFSGKADQVEAATVPTHQPQHAGGNVPQPSKKFTVSGKNLAMAMTMKSNTAPSIIVDAHPLATTLFRIQHAHGLTQAVAKKLPWLTAPPKKTQSPTQILKISAQICYVPTRCLWADDQGVAEGGGIVEQAKEHCLAICCALSGGDREGGGTAVRLKRREA
jgi:hypothetical protein